jgi:ATP-dependent RNA helicase RhlE
MVGWSCCALQEARGDALTLVAPTEEADLRTIERAIGTRIPRVTLPDFDYGQRAAAERLEIPLDERLAAMRAQRREQRRGVVGNRCPRRSEWCASLEAGPGLGPGPEAPRRSQVEAIPGPRR